MMKTKMNAGIALLILSFSGYVGAGCNANMAITKPDSIYVDHGDGAVTDKQTGLMWMKCTQGKSGATCGTGGATAMNWKQALEAAQAANNGAGTFSYTDWRLPSVSELRTLVEEACSNGAINTVIFPSTVSSNGYWTSSPANRYSATNVWAINFYYGREGTVDKSGSLYTRLVRGGQ